MDNLITFAALNPWTTGLTALTLIVFVVVWILANGKQKDAPTKKVGTVGVNVFMLVMVSIVCGSIALMATVPDFAKLIDASAIVYWIGVFILWYMVHYVTGIDPHDLI